MAKRSKIQPIRVWKKLKTIAVESSTIGWLVAFVFLASPPPGWGQTTDAATPGVPATTLISHTAFDLYTRRFLDAHGDRFYQAGKERVTLSGVVTISGTDSSIAIVSELPGKIRVTQNGASAKTLVFDGAKAASLAGSLGTTDQDVLDTLVTDREDYFFYSLLSGSAGRALGSRFRTDDGSNPNYSGPYYDIYELTGPGLILGTPVRRKRYAFDSASGLLHYVMYTVDRQEKTVHVVTVLDNWKSVGGQFFPGTIVRSEDGSVAFSVRLDAAVFGPATSDASFTTP